MAENIKQIQIGTEVRNIEDASAVHFTEQTLTEAQQQQVLQNLGISEDLFELGQIITELQQDSLTKKEQTLTAEEKAQVQTNIGVKDVMNVVGIEEVSDSILEVGDNSYYRSKNSGSKISNIYSFISKPILLNPGDIIIGVMYGTAAMSLMSEIDSAGNFIKNMVVSIDSAGNAENHIYYIAPHTMYVEFSGLKTSLDRKFIKLSSKLTKSLAAPGGYSKDLFLSCYNVESYNETENVYLVNGLKLTPEEMAIAYTELRDVVPGSIFNVLYNPFRTSKARTNIMSIREDLSDNYKNQPIYMSNFSALSNLEVFVFSTNTNYYVDIANTVAMFYGARKLREVIGMIRIENISSSYTFRNCFELEKISIVELAGNVSFAESSKLTKESILYMIQNSAASSAITITLHPDAYAMAMADTDIQAALGEKTFVSLASA